MFHKQGTIKERGAVMISKKMANAVNDQMNFEIYSSYIYASMSSWFKAQNLNGFANWMSIQVREEMDHAIRFFGLLHDYGADVVFEAIPKPPNKWKDPVDVFTHTLKHEGIVTSRINKLIDQALAEKDHATNARLQWFINEQIEEEATAIGILQQLKLIKGSPDALLLMDRELALRVYTPPVTGQA